MDELCDDGDPGDGPTPPPRTVRPPAAGPPEIVPLGAMLLRPVPESVPLARQRLADALGSRLAETPLDDCLLLLSELIANAVLHADHADADHAEADHAEAGAAAGPRGRGPLLRVEWWREGLSLCVAVHSPGSPAAVTHGAANVPEAAAERRPPDKPNAPEDAGGGAVGPGGWSDMDAGAAAGGGVPLAEVATHGRGLRLVDALADSWQIAASRHGGTAVAFTLAGVWPP